MRKLLLLFAFSFWLLTVPTFAQQTFPVNSNAGNILSANANCVHTACLGIKVSNLGTITVVTTGTFSMTLVPEGSTDGTNFTSAGANITSTGTTTYSASGLVLFRIRASAFVSGNAGITISGSSTGVTVSPGGSNTQVQFNDNGVFNGDAAFTFVKSSGVVTLKAVATATNCAVNSVSPAACGSAASGAFVVPTTTTTYTVNTTAVTASSRIFLIPTTDASNLPSAPTCVAPPTGFIAIQSSRVAGTSFTFTLPSTTGQSCWNYLIMN